MFFVRGPRFYVYFGHIWEGYVLIGTICSRGCVYGVSLWGNKSVGLDDVVVLGRTVWYYGDIYL